MENPNNKIIPEEKKFNFGILMDEMVKEKGFEYVGHESLTRTKFNPENAKFEKVQDKTEDEITESFKKNFKEHEIEFVKDEDKIYVFVKANK